MKKNSVVVAAVVVVGVVAVSLWLKSNRTSSASAPHAREIATSDAAAASGESLPRFVDLGTTTCAPCKVMLGVMDELERTYPGAMEIEFVNVHEHRDAAQRYGIRIIPTQIFYAPDGRELFRHTGVYRAEQIIAKWAELGYTMHRSRER